MIISGLVPINRGLNLDDPVSGTVWDYNVQPIFIRLLLSVSH